MLYEGTSHKPGGLTRYPGYNNNYFTVLASAIMCGKQSPKHDWLDSVQLLALKPNP